MASFSPTIGKFGDVTSRQRPWTRWYKRHKLALFSTLTVLIVIAAGATAWWFWQGRYQPASGGVLEEGIVGHPQFLNPLYSSLNPIDTELTPLIFRGLLKYDQKQQLTGDLADNWQQSDDGKTYTIKLGQHTWHDGRRVTSQDVAFTISLTQDSNYTGSWSHSFTDVTVKIIDDYNLQLNLKQPFAPFAQNLTIGLLPQHLLSKISIKDLASSTFNHNPVGTGPLVFKSLETNPTTKAISSIRFDLTDGYLEGLNFHFYDNLSQLITDFKLGKIQAFGSQYSSQLSALDNFDKQQQNRPLQGQSYGLYFNLNSPAVKEVIARQALAQALDKKAVLNQALGSNWTDSTNVYPTSSWAYIDNIKQPAFDFNLAQDTWAKLKSKPDQITLVIPEKDTHSSVANAIAQAWQKLDLQVDVVVKEGEALNTLLNSHTGYDVILLGEKTRQDPDRYTNWHSTQTPPTGLNITGLSNQRIDRALEEGRTLTKQDQRKVKYGTFQNLLAQELPVLWLYQPSYVYTWSNKVYGLEVPSIWTESDRFANIDKWYINVERQNP